MRNYLVLLSLPAIKHFVKFKNYFIDCNKYDEKIRLVLQIPILFCGLVVL